MQKNLPNLTKTTLNTMSVCYEADQHYKWATSIPWQADFHAAPRNLPLAVEFAACRGETWNCPFLLHLYLIQGFSGSILILPFITQ